MLVKTSRLPFFDGLETKEAIFQKKSFPTHCHDTYSIGIITKGSEKICIENTAMTAHAGSIVVINPHQLHSNTFFDEDAWAYQCVYVGEDALRCVVGKAQNPYFPTQIIDDEGILQKLLRIWGQASQAENLWADALQALVGKFATDAPEKQLAYADNQTMQDAEKYLQANISDKVDLDAIAQKFCLGKGQFIRNFKKQTGLTPISYLLMHRINEAKKRIQEGYSLTEVSLAVGFYDQAHFIKYFQKYVGISPLQYKRGVSTC